MLLGPTHWKLQFCDNRVRHLLNIFSRRYTFMKPADYLNYENVGLSGGSRILCLGELNLCVNMEFIIGNYMLYNRNILFSLDVYLYNKDYFLCLIISLGLYWAKITE